MSSYELLCTADAVQILSLAYCVLMLVFATVISVAFFSGHNKLGKKLLYSYCITLFVIVVIGRCL